MYHILGTDDDVSCYGKVPEGRLEDGLPGCLQSDMGPEAGMLSFPDFFPLELVAIH